MIPYFNLEQINVGSIPIALNAWGFTLSLAIIFGYAFFSYRAEKKQIMPDKIFYLSMLILVSAIIGSRIFFVLTNAGLFKYNYWSIFNLSSGGMVYYGGLLFALLAGIIFSKKLKNFFILADLALPAILLGLFIGRIGCFLTSEHQGSITSLPWGIIWPDGTIRHPVALYLMIFALALFIISLYTEKRFKKTGKFFLFFIVLESVGRFILDFARSNDTSISELRWFGFTAGQITAIMIITVVVFVWKYFLRNSNKNDKIFI